MADSSSEAVLLDPSAWTLLELTGEDRLEWLQGQATNDVRHLTRGKSLSFCLCEPNGSLLAVLDAWALEDRILMTTARELEQAVLDRVERMTILEDVSAAVSSKTLLSIGGAEAGQRLSEILELSELEAGTAELDGETVFALRSRRISSGGWDLWVTPDRATEITSTFTKMPSEDYEAERIAAGIPKWGVDMGPKTLPPELGTDFESRHISYQKGCYTGQEVLMRIHSRGAHQPHVGGAHVNSGVAHRSCRGIRRQSRGYRLVLRMVEWARLCCGRDSPQRGGPGRKTRRRRWRPGDGSPDAD